MSQTTLLILYNASGSLLGHAAYAYHHLRSTPGRDCSACALTHGPTLSLNETAGWTGLKKKLEEGELLEGRRVHVKELHTEDLTAEIKEHLRLHDMALPSVLSQETGGQLDTVFTKSELDEFRGDQARFEAALRSKMSAIQ